MSLLQILVIKNYGNEVVVCLAVALWLCVCRSDRGGKKPSHQV